MAVRNITRLVADLNTKERLQEEMLRQSNCLAETSVMRASELWRHVLKIYFTDIEAISPQLMSVWLQEWLKEQKIEWARQPGSSQTLLSYLHSFLPVLVREESIERLKEWLTQNPDALLRWGNWFFLCQNAWQFLREQNVLLPQWIPAYLAARDDLPENFWPYDLIVDLGPALTGVEAELIVKLKRTRDIEIVLPNLVARSRHPQTFAAYHVIDPQTRPVSDWSNENIMYHRFASELAEVKAAVHWLRERANMGVALEKLGVFSADIEKYWPLLEAYCRIEGLPVQKPVVLSAQSLPAMQSWLARLRIEANVVTSGDLETVLFTQPAAAIMAYEKFAPLFRKIYDEADLEREATVRKVFHHKFRASEKISREVFFAWALAYWQGDVNGLDRVAALLLQECPSRWRLELRSWLQYLESLSAKIEIKKGGDAGGLYCGNLDGAIGLKLDTTILLGLTAENIRPARESGISNHDREKLISDLGVHLNSEERDWSYWVERIADETVTCCHACYALHDLASRPQSPAAIWLNAVKEGDGDIGEAPGVTRWDEIQATADINSNRRLAQDAAFIDADSIILEELPKFSASQIEKYLECPFQFAAEKIFKLSDLPDVDLDVDAMTNGRLVHEILNRILEPPYQWQWSTQKLHDLIDDVRGKIGVALGAETLWPVFRDQLAATAQRFLEFEKNWRSRHPETATVLREGLIQGQIEIKNSEGRPLKIEVTGRIDRVDRAQTGEYVVLDYKSSGADLRNHASWFENNELQLLFYSYCIENGLSSLPNAPVLGAFYFTLSDMRREKGFRNPAGAPKLFQESPRSKTHISREEIERMYENLRGTVARVVESVMAGHFAPKPTDTKICHECNWRTLCRAPHLN